MKDYLLQIKIKNGPMMSMMRANGIKTAAELSRASGVTSSTVGHYLNLKKTPITIYGHWSDSVLKIAKFLKVPPEMLFPEQHLTKALKRNTIEGEVTLEEMGELVSTAGINYISEEIEKKAQDELHDKLEKCLGTLPSRERKVLEKRFGINRYSIEKPSPEEMLSDEFKEIDLTKFPKVVWEYETKGGRKGSDGGETYDQIAEDFSVTRERIRQIEQEALRKLRQPSRMGKSPRDYPREREERNFRQDRKREELKKKDALRESRKDPRGELIKKASSQGGRWHHLVEHD